MSAPFSDPLGGHAVDVLVDLVTAARMFWMNLSVFRQSAVTHGVADDDRLDALPEQLRALQTEAATTPVR